MGWYWRDVGFDGGAAERYAQRLEAAAGSVRLLRDLIDDHAASARKDWAGEAEEAFRSDTDDLWDRAGQLAADLDAGAEGVRAKLDSARRDQARREVLRARDRERMEGRIDP